ncbi:MAG: hypothetical protein ICV66_06055 [Chitinophagaceae bacterium]|nr:hypothetical protein [Chitinophagaceae bacterium]
MKTESNNTPSGNVGIESRLWEYIDGISPEAATIEKLIAENAEWRQKYQELLELHQLISASELEQPSLRFTKNVMEQIAKYHIAPATKNYINNRIIWGIAAFFILVIAGFIIYAIAQINWSAGTSTNVSGIDFSKVDYSRIFSNTFVNIFMMMNVVLGLMLLDRYLSNKKKQLQKEA